MLDRLEEVVEEGFDAVGEAVEEGFEAVGESVLALDDRVERARASVETALNELVSVSPRGGERNDIPGGGQDRRRGNGVGGHLGV